MFGHTPYVHPFMVGNFPLLTVTIDTSVTSVPWLHMDVCVDVLSSCVNLRSGISESCGSVRSVSSEASSLLS